MGAGPGNGYLTGTDAEFAGDRKHGVESAKVGSEFTMRAVRHQIAVMPDMVSECAAKVRAEGITHEIVDRLVDTIGERAKSLSRIYGQEVTEGAATAAATGR